MNTPIPASPRTSRRRRICLVVLGLLFGIPAVGLLTYLVLRPTAPADGPRVGLVMASSFVIQRPLYEDAVARAGGQTVLITPTDDDARLVATLERVDAVLLTGGDDVDPAVYGGGPSDAGATERQRDEFEIRLIRAALERDLPILGICRGIQILNVAHGGSLRNLRSDETLADHHGIGLNSFTAHSVVVQPGTRLAEVLGPGTRRVNSFHGQAVDRVGEGLTVCAVADDGIVEGLERSDRTFILGIQWHPEITSLTDAQALALFETLVGHAKAHRTAAAP